MNAVRTMAYHDVGEVNQLPRRHAIDLRLLHEPAASVNAL
jgi:hypothetical protein